MSRLIMNAKLIGDESLTIHCKRQRTFAIIANHNNNNKKKQWFQKTIQNKLLMSSKTLKPTTSTAAA